MSILPFARRDPLPLLPATGEQELADRVIHDAKHRYMTGAITVDAFAEQLTAAGTGNLSFPCHACGRELRAALAEEMHPASVLSVGADSRTARRRARRAARRRLKDGPPRSQWEVTCQCAASNVFELRSCRGN